ncbi:MAG: pilin [Candidatus Absconditicoccaceae bacterium]
MKFKLIYYITILLLTILNIGIFADVSSQGLQLGQDDIILNTDIDNALDVYDNNNPITDPLRQGAYKIIDADSTNTISNQELGGIVNPGLIQDHGTAMNSTMAIIKNIINYALGLVSVIALVYLIYHGFLMVTAAGDDTQYKKGMKGLKFAAIALVGIGLSWLVISFIFWIINYVAL